MSRLRILFLCTGNSCRSQMAEGWARMLKGDDVEAYSAGIVAKGVDPRAVRVMSEAGVDITAQVSKTLDALPDVHFDHVVTLCGHAAENCPLFLGGATHVHRGFDDPPSLASMSDDEEVALGHYRRVRDEIRRFVAAFPASLEQDWVDAPHGTHQAGLYGREG